MIAKPKRPRGAALGAIGAAVLAAALFAAILAAGPKHNWDMIPYIACADGLADAEKDPAALQSAAYRAVRAAVPPETYRELTDPIGWANTYRKTLASDPRAFAETLPVYCYKLAYVAAIAGVSAFGVAPPTAAFLVSASAAAAAVLLLGLWLGRRIGALGPPVLIVAAMAGLYQTARYATPDAMLALLLIGGLIAYAEGRVRLGAAILTAALLVRMDAIVYLGAYLAIAGGGALRGRAGFRAQARVIAPLAGFAALGLALYAAIGAWIEPPGYRAVFVHSFIANIPMLASADPPLAFSTYLDVLGARSLEVLERGAKLPILILLTAAALLATRAEDDPARRRAAQAAGLALAAAALHFLIFPWYSTRYYAGHLAIMTAGALVALLPVAASLAARHLGEVPRRPPDGGAP
ncbi:MAG: hypothetical protein RIB45_15460 [Marivibrio sp.]|uniref:hypothetical protein n=1 Tax=Marivibrio sp. TaxID=2039719 RepID=UPI0032EE4C54